MDFLLPLTAIFWISLIQAAGAGLQGAIGYGMALVSGPILLLIDPRLMPGPFLVSSTFLSILVILRERKEMRLGSLGWAIAGRMVGATLAASLLAVLASSTINLSFAFIILFGVALSLIGWKLSPTRVNLLVAGTLSGVMGTIAGIGGPPMALIYQHETSARLRAHLTIFFVFGTLISILSLIPVQKFGMTELGLSLNLLPGTLIGFILSSWLAPRLNSKHTRAIVLGVAVFSAVVVILKQAL
jgi:uncharacterized membrane protein YfcA